MSGSAHKCQIFGIESVAVESDRPFVNHVCQMIERSIQIPDNLMITVTYRADERCYFITTDFTQTAINASTLIEGLKNMGAVVHRWAMFSAVPKAQLRVVVRRQAPTDDPAQPLPFNADAPKMHVGIQAKDVQIRNWKVGADSGYALTGVRETLKMLCLNVIRKVVCKYIDLEVHWVPSFSSHGTDKIITFDNCVSRCDLKVLVGLAEELVYNSTATFVRPQCVVEVNLGRRQVIYRYSIPRAQPTPLATSARSHRGDDIPTSYTEKSTWGTMGKD